jgi:hypothetical protein
MLIRFILQGRGNADLQMGENRVFRMTRNAPICSVPTVDFPMDLLAYRALVVAALKVWCATKVSAVVWNTMICDALLQEQG